MALALILVPLAFAVLAFAVPSNRGRPWLVPAGGLAHAGLVASALAGNAEVSGVGGWLLLDGLGRLFLGFLSVLFVPLSLYAPAYLRLRADRSNRTLCACLLASLAMMTWVTLSHHLGLLWVAIEATTLVTAPSIYFNHNPRSLEATWKYLLICSVGVALALLGSFFLAYALLYSGHEPTLLLGDLVTRAPFLSAPWLHAAFVFAFVGYGTKMGLAPMHTWKPDAYGEAPGLVGALAAGGLTSCAFLAILRFYQVANAAHDSAYVQRIMVAVGLFSMVLAAVSMARQRDIKRLLAYSSVEHMGIMVLAVGLGGPAVLWGLAHVVHNGLTKGVLFLSAGNIHRAYGTKLVNGMSGVVHRLPVSGWLFVAGFFAITASPPFAPFVSEFNILNAAFQAGRYLVGAVFVTCLLLVFIGMGSVVLPVAFGPPSDPPPEAAGFRDGLGTSLAPLLFMALVLWLGVAPPAFFQELLRDAAQDLQVGSP